MSKVQVRFLRDKGSAKKGMVETYPAKLAERLIKEGVAEKVIKAKPVKAEPVSKTVKKEK